MFDSIMISGAASNPKAGEPPKHQQHQLPPASAIPVAFHAQHHQPFAPALMTLGVAGGPAATWGAAQHEDWLRAMAQPSSAAGRRRRGVSASVPASVVASSVGRAPRTQQTVGKETGKPSQSTQQAGQMGSGALSNAIGAWTSTGICVSRSRAGRVDESVDVGAQANPSGVYPIMQPMPMAYLSRPQRPPGVPSHMFGGPLDSQQQQQQQQQHAAKEAGTTNPRPPRVHSIFGPGKHHQHLSQEVGCSRPVSAPAGSCFHPGGEALKRPPPPSLGVGLRRTSTAAIRGKVGTAAAGAGSSKAAMRAAARAAAAASVISAVADSRKTEARAAAAVTAAGAQKAAAGAAAVAGSTELEEGDTGRLKGRKSERERKGRGSGGGGNLAEDQPHRPATAPASTAAAVAAPKYAHPQPLSFPHTPNAAGSYEITPWGAGVSVPTPMPSPAEWADPWGCGQGLLDTFPAPTPPQPPPPRPPQELARATGTTAAATPAAAAAAAKEEAHSEALTAKSARTSPVPRVDSSPESEDMYTDSWLTEMPWASCSPPNAEGLEVEVPVAPAPLDALRSDDRGARDDDDDDDVGDGEDTVLFLDHQSMSGIQEIRDKNGESVRLALEAAGNQDSPLPFPREQESPQAESIVSTQGSTADLKIYGACAGGSRAPAAIAAAGVDADNHGGLQPSPQSRQHEAAPTMVGTGADVFETGCARGNTSPAVLSLRPMTDAPSSSPRPVAEHAPKTMPAPAVKEPGSPPGPLVSSSPVAAAAAAAVAAAAAATAAALFKTPTALASATFLPPQPPKPSPPLSVPPPPSSSVAVDPALQQPLPDTSATSLPDWANHPPPLLELDVTSLTSSPQDHPRREPSATGRPGTAETVDTAVGEESTATGPTGATAVAARPTRNSTGIANESRARGTFGAVAKSTASSRRRAPRTATAAVIQATAAAAGKGAAAARAKSPATATREEQRTTEAPATGDMIHTPPPPKPKPDARETSAPVAGSTCSAASWSCSDGGGQKAQDCKLRDTERSRVVVSTCKMRGAQGSGGSSPRGSKRANDAATEKVQEAGSATPVAHERNEDQGRDGDKGATATRRSKRRRSSGNLLQ